MTRFNRDLSMITDEELEAVKHLTFKNARRALGLDSKLALKRLYVARGIDYSQRKRAETTEYHTQHPSGMVTNVKRGSNGRKHNRNHGEW